MLDVSNLFAGVLRAVGAAAGDDSDVALLGALEAKAEEKPALRIQKGIQFTLLQIAFCSSI